MKNRVEVLHGVNLDMLGRRDPEHYGRLTLPELEVKIKRFAAELGLEVGVLPDQPRGRVRRVPAPPARARRRGDAQRRRLDPLQLRDPRRARDRAACRRSRSTSPTSSRARTGGANSVFEGLVLGTISGKGPDGYREALEHAEGGARAVSERAPTGSRRSSPSEGLDQLLVGDLVRPGDSVADAISNLR